MKRPRSTRPDLGPHSFALPALAVAIALVGCDRAPAGPSRAPSADGGAPYEMMLRQTLEPADAPSARATPAPLVIQRTTPSGAIAACPLAAPPGVCDRCPASQCRQVRLSLHTAPSETEWAMFCEEGDLVEEAEIACLCAGGSAPVCARAGFDAAQALMVLNVRFGGRVPPIGTRYRDAYGLRARVDRDLHDWLAGVAGPRYVPRCEPPDREGAQRSYALGAQRVRMTGACD